VPADSPFPSPLAPTDFAPLGADSGELSPRLEEGFVLVGIVRDGSKLSLHVGQRGGDARHELGER